MSNEEDIYSANRQEWNERYGVFVRDAKRWRLIAAGAMLVAILSLIIVTLTVQQPRLIPYIVEMDSESIPIRAAPAARVRASDAMTKAILARWINNFRLVTIDRTVQSRSINSVYAHLISGHAGHGRVNEWYRANNPFERAAVSTVSVDIRQILRISDSTWRVEWRETVRSRSGAINALETGNYVATVSIVVAEPTEETILVNPTGQIWTEIDWSKAQ